MSIRKSLQKYRTAVFDTETDPFKPGRYPEPFAAGFLTDDGVYIETWGDNCIDEIMRQIRALDQQYLIYCHNGGRFDYYFLFQYIEAPVFLIGSRLVEFGMGGDETDPHHIWRDSIAIIPVALSAYQKTEIDYRKFERDVREKPTNKAEIRAYLRDDCRDLLDLVTKFRERFEEKGKVPLTFGQLSMREFRKFHPFERATERTDGLMRQFYFGGRTQCFVGGIHKGPFVYFDINSSYPAAMKNAFHPVSDDWEEVDSVPGCEVWFAEVDGINRQGLPVKIKDKTEFDTDSGVFFACSHELVPAIEMGLFDVREYKRIWKPVECARFDGFVDHFYNERVRTTDKAHKLFLKFILNSAYGKTGQDPRKFREYALCVDPFDTRALVAEGFESDTLLSREPFFELWSKPSPINDWSFFNVGIAASITSAARANMMRGLSASTDPVYCDTDSVICRQFNGDIDESRLGAWKQETWKPFTGKESWRTEEKFRTAPSEPIKADYIAIGGRKCYCLYNKVGKRIIPIKWASKGGDLTPQQIINIAEDKSYHQVNEAPTFSFTSGSSFVHRTFRKTVPGDVRPFKRS